MTDNLGPVELLQQYKSYLLGKGKLKKTVKAYLSPVRHLFRYMEKNKTKRINRIDKDIISAFQLYLYDEYDFNLETMFHSNMLGQRITWLRYTKPLKNILMQVG